MRIRFIAPLFLLAACALQATAAATSSVVDIPAVSGGTQRYLYVRPDASIATIATIIVIPGGDGVLAIQNDGSMNTTTGLCGPVVRNRLAYAERGFALALVDATSNGTIYNFNDISAVINDVRLRANVPVWVTGGSASTAITASMAANLPASIPAGVVFFSPQQFSTSLVGSIRRPAFVIYHEGDIGQFGAALYAALTAATPRGVAGLNGGSNAGCGFHLFNGIDAAFISATAAFMTANNPSGSAAASYQGLWWRSPAQSENGWGVNIAHQGDILFVTWYTYDTDGSPMWLFSDARKTTGTTYTGALYQSRGSPFAAVPYDATRFTATTVGSVTLSFTDANNGTFSYTVNGTSQSKPITKFLYASPVPTCAPGSSVSSSNYTDLWWRSPGGSENGWGVNLVHQGDILFATWYTYGADGTDLWMVMDSATKIADRTYRGNVYRTTSAPFNAYDPTRFAGTSVGTGTFTFTDASNGTFSFTVDGSTQSKPITRYVFSSPPTNCSP